MINASEARALSLKNEQALNQMLNTIEHEIIKAAEDGKDHIALYKETPWYGQKLYEIHDVVKPSPLQSRIIAELEVHGFSAAVEQYGSVYEEGPCTYTNYCIVVRW